MFGRLSLLSCTILILLATLAAAQTLEVIPVPADPDDPAIPHTTYQGRPTRLAAIARTAGTPPPTIWYRWDADGDGVWDTDAYDPTGFTGDRWYAGTAYDLGFGFHYQDTGTARLHNAVIQVNTSPSAIGSSFASVPVMVMSGLPDPQYDPAWADNADDQELAVMRSAALDEALWHLHTRLNRSGATGNEISGWFSSNYQYTSLCTAAAYLSALVARGYLPAYPPGTYDNLGVTPPPGFEAANDARWNASPYAEDAARMVNLLVANLSAVLLSVPASDEVDDGTVPINGTNDGQGWAVYGSLLEQGPATPMALAALANSGLAGTVAQVGTRARGKTLEFIVQQMVDYVAAAQYDENSGPQAVGAWGYSPCLNCGASASVAYAHHFGWSVHALHEAESAMGGDGVHVPEFVKLRLPNMLYYNPFTDGGPRYTTAGASSTFSMFEPTGHFLLACRWLGWDQWDPYDPTPEAYPSLTLTRGQARQIHDDLLAYAEARWTQFGTGSLGDPNTVLWGDGDYSSGARGHSFFLPMLATAHGPVDAGQSIGSRDWAREFAVDLVLQQKSGTNWYSSYTTSHYTLLYWSDDGHTALAALLMAGLGTLEDTTAPAAPAQFQVDYSGGYNFLSWSPSTDGDVVGYRVHSGPTQPVPITPETYVGETTTTTMGLAGASWDDFYRLVAVDWAGNVSDPVAPTQVTSVPGGSAAPTLRTGLGRAYPNPFNPTTRIPFSLAEAGEVSLRIYDVQGRLVRELLAGTTFPAGGHHVAWDGRDDAGRIVGAGLYVHRFECGEASDSGRIVLVK